MTPRQSRAIVLMYHAVAYGLGEGNAADAHYTVSVASFKRHLAIAKASGLQLVSVARQLVTSSASRCVALTFDDGHASSSDAAHLIGAVGGCADFFVNSSTVGTPHMVSWQELRSMSATGMSIQSHGHTHRYLDSLPPAEVHDELLRSKKMIEDKVGAPVTLFAPPGGRMRADLPNVAATLGYAAVCSSKVGVWKLDERAREIPRFAVLATTTDDRLRSWLEQRASEIAKARVRHAVLSGAKRTLGTRRYEQLRALLQGSEARPADGVR